MFNKKIIIKINGMSCSHCAKRVEDALKEIDNIKKVKVNLDDNTAIISYKDEIDLDLVKNKINDLDYEYIGVVE